MAAVENIARFDVPAVHVFVGFKGDFFVIKNFSLKFSIPKFLASPLSLRKK
jgi:hypothetical protein